MPRTLARPLALSSLTRTLPRHREHEGGYTALGIALSPRPIQCTRLPLHVAANSAETASWSGSQGLLAIFAAHVHTFPKLQPLLAAYREAREQAGEPALQPDDVTLLMPLFVGETQAEARAQLEPSVRHYARLSETLARAALPKTPEAQRQQLAPLLEHLRSLDYDSIAASMGVLGTPEHCVERLQQIRRDFGAGRIIAWFNFGGLVPHAAVLRSMSLFASHVMPYCV